MSTKLSRIRVKNLLEALDKADALAVRCQLDENSNVRELGTRINDQLEDWVMELGMLLANDEDGSTPL
jgi:hypothetical protein